MFIIKEILWFCNKKCGINKDIKKINGPEGRGFRRRRTGQQLGVCSISSKIFRKLTVRAPNETTTRQPPALKGHNRHSPLRALRGRNARPCRQVQRERQKYRLPRQRQNGFWQGIAPPSSGGLLRKRRENRMLSSWDFRRKHRGQTLKTPGSFFSFSDRRICRRYRRRWA